MTLADALYLRHFHAVTSSRASLDQLLGDEYDELNSPSSHLGNELLPSRTCASHPSRRENLTDLINEALLHISPEEVEDIAYESDHLSECHILIAAPRPRSESSHFRPAQTRQ